MQRRDFIKLAGGAWLLSQVPSGWARETPADEGWRKFRLTYTVNLLPQGSNAYLWLPIPQSIKDYQQASAPRSTGAADEAGFVRMANAPAFYAHWNDATARNITVTAEVATRDRTADLQRSHSSPAELDDAMLNYLPPTDSMPLDGIVRSTALAATKGAISPLEKARAIYDWVVDNTFREPKVKGCGRGDIKAMLETGNLGGKCADINSLFVGLCRASGIPAREVYGIRIAESRQFKSLGRSGDVSRAQHCRAEFYLADVGWIPVDAADVRKAVLEEKLPLDDPGIVALRERLFGGWEMNWVAFNHARNVALGPRHKASFFMYPCAEIAGEQSDSLNPESFAYRVEASAQVG
ncbi:MAG TPA: transglutaminase family protein [Novimethylophilus sp.]|uniref:transglutaminase-like domain-containing protein n=1 Tax=Novimethylophilus sp. TaxID=2137426 RepID=UPI002F40E691